MAFEDGEIEVEKGKLPNFATKVSHEIKLRELLHKITSNEIKLCSYGTKEFIRLLKSSDGGQLLCQYVSASSKCSELLDAWKIRCGKPGMYCVFKLISAILSHHKGKYNPNDAEKIAISRALDRFARLIVEEYMGDIYKELNSKEEKRQKAALLLMISIVRRGSGLASEVAKSFDFKLKEFIKFSMYKQKQNEKKVKPSLRKSLVWFAMSFLEVGKPGLLRWVLQQREMFFGILRGLGADDDETIVYVLTTLRDRVLVEESLVSPGLRSVLFGSVTLEQLADISGRESGGLAAEMAHKVLVMVCTDPSNGLMPDLKRHPNPLRGNPKRIMWLMKKLKATEIGHHRDLLLAIVHGRPSFGSAYLEEFPYNIEDYTSPSWFSSISLAANLVSSVGSGLSNSYLNSQLHEQNIFDGSDMQSTLKSFLPRTFSRSVINKGLLHSDFLVNHGTLRLLLEMLKLLSSLFVALNHGSCSSKQPVQTLNLVRQEIENEVKVSLPDPQVLLRLLSSLDDPSRSHGLCVKRTTAKEYDDKRIVKKLKMNIADEDIDIVVGGINNDSNIALTEGSGKDDSTLTADKMDLSTIIADIWGIDLCSSTISTQENAKIYFHSKLLDALKYYMQIVPTMLERSSEFFMGLLNNSLHLPSSLQSALLSFLIEYVGCSPKRGIPMKIPSLMYKHLQTFIRLFMFSPVSDIRDQAYLLAKAGMLSTGAFDNNPNEVGSWLLFLPGYDRKNQAVNSLEMDVMQSLSIVVISFLCDAVSTVGNNLVKYLDILKCNIHRAKSLTDISPNFSPLMICVLEKCIRLLHSKSGTTTLSKKSMVLLYVCNTLKYLMQTEVDAGLFSVLVDEALSERLRDCNDSGEFISDWRSLKSLLRFSQSIFHQQSFCIFSILRNSVPLDSSFVRTLDEVKRFSNGGDHGDTIGITLAFISSIICVGSDQIMLNFPSVMKISKILHGIPFSFLSSIFFLEHTVLSCLPKFWHQMFTAGLDMVVSVSNCDDNRNDDAPGNCGSLLYQQISSDEYSDTTEEDASAFSLFLSQAPFHVLLPAMMSINGLNSLELSKTQELLLSKLFECPIDCLISSLRQILFWIRQLQLYYKLNPLDMIEQHSKSCVLLVKKLLDRLLVQESDSDYSRDIEDFAETIFYHPAISVSISFSMHNIEAMKSGDFIDLLDALIRISKQDVHELNYVIDILAITLDHVWSFCNSEPSVCKIGDAATKKLVKAFNFLLQKLFLEVKDVFEECIGSKDLMPLIPTLHTLHALIQFIPPFRLLEMVDWMFGRIKDEDLTGWRSLKIYAISVGCSITAGAFRNLATYLEQPIEKRVAYDLFWEMGENDVKSNIIEGIYMKVVEFSITFGAEFADKCLLEAMSAVNRQKCMQHEHLHPLNLSIWRVLMITPVNMISHCLHEINMIKSKILLFLVEMSSLHSSTFGHIVLGIFNKKQHGGDVVEGTQEFTLTHDQMMMLLPASLSYLNSISIRYGKEKYEKLRSIPFFYSKVLFKGFQKWKSFASRDIFWEQYSECLPSSLHELLCTIDGSLLGKSVHMLQNYYDFCVGSVKVRRRLNLFNCIFPPDASQDELLEDDGYEMGCYSINQSMNIISRVVVKISLSRMLLFPGEVNGNTKEDSLEGELKKLEPSRMRFMNVLVDIWQSIAKKSSSLSGPAGQAKMKNISTLYNHLEVFVLGNILDLTALIHDDIIRLQSIPFLDQLVRSALLHKFQDPRTLKMLQVILTSLCEGNLSCSLYLRLLVAHSQFASTMLEIPNVSPSLGASLKPLSSILGFLVIPSDMNVIEGKLGQQPDELLQRHTEFVRLLRILFQGNAHRSFDFGNDCTINFKELHSLLSYSYGATLSEIDLEIYKLMQEIESVTNIAVEMDYPWGTAALKLKNEQVLECDTSSMICPEAIEDQCRCQFRDNLPIDPKMCASTVLYFPYDVGTHNELMSICKIQPGNFELQSPPGESREVYNPVFILGISIYSLSKGYIDPVEFAGLGLLAIAFVSISSPDDETRRLGYDTLDRFKGAIEKCQKLKSVMQLRLLLTLVQNSIEEPWQRIPPVIAVFAAEASCILLDASHDHNRALSELLIRTSRLNMKAIPFFHDFFWSTSANFKEERLWMLRLVYAGLNSDDDACIYIKNDILETLMSFYVSPLSDNESKALILQVVMKSLKLQKTACYLVKHCALIPWVSSLLSSFGVNLNGDEKRNFWKHILMVVKVVINAISFKSIKKWLQKQALEQLMELSSHLCSFMLGHLSLIREAVGLINPLLQIIVSTLKMSQKRKTYEPHFNLSLEVLHELYHVVYVCNNGAIRVDPLLYLEVLLLNTPMISILEMHKEKLLSFLLRATSTASQVDSSQSHKPRESLIWFNKDLGDEPHEDSFTSKLLRWLTASVIIWKLPWRYNNVDTELPSAPSIRNLQSLMEHIFSEGKKKIICGMELAALIFHLQQRVGIDCGILPSVTCALCLLIFDAPNSKESGFDLLPSYGNILPSLCLRIRCPPEANRHWRWSFKQAWRDSSELTESEVMDEYHACSALLVIISKVLSGQPLSHLDIEKCANFNCERSHAGTDHSHQIDS